MAKHHDVRKSRHLPLSLCPERHSNSLYPRRSIPMRVPELSQSRRYVIHKLSRIKQAHGYLHLLFRTSPNNIDVTLLVVGILAATAAGAPFPILGILFGQLVDDINSRGCDAAPTAEQNARLDSAITQKVLLIIYLAIFNFAVIYIHAGCFSLFGERLVGRLRRQYFKSLLRQDIAFFDTLPPGEVSARLTTDIEIIRTGTSEKVGIFISSIAYFVGAYIVAFIKSPPLAAQLTFLVPAYVLMVMMGGKYIGRYTAKTSEHLGAAAALVSQALGNLALVQALGASARLEAKVTEILRKARGEALKKTSAAACQFGFMFLVAYAANAVAFWKGSKEIADAAGKGGQVTAGSVYTVIFVLLDASFVISQVAPFLQIFGAATGAAHMIQSVVQRDSRIDGTKSTLDFDITTSGIIDFDHVSFAYPSRPEIEALKDLSLHLEAGKHTGIVGVSGSGKSTIGGLITRLYDANKGRITLDGQDIINLNIRQLRRCVGIVEQEPSLLNCSIFENIAFGLVNSGDLNALTLGSSLAQHTKAVRKGADFYHALAKEPPLTQTLFQKVRAAAVQADAHSFINALPQGYATLVGTGSSELSGGQKQRLALARALVKDPAILVLDEATSALDSSSELQILNALRTHRNGKTTITIAHRLATVKEADNIIVMHEGKVVESGTHEGLLEQEGMYKTMTETQSVNVSALVTAGPSEISTITTSTGASELKEMRGLEKEASIILDPDKGFPPPRQKSPSLLSTLRCFAPFARPQLLYLFCGFVGALVAGGSYSGDAVIFGHTIGHLDPCEGAEKVRSTGNLAGLLFFILAIVAFFANLLAGTAFGRVAEKMVYKIRILTFRSLLSHDLTWHSSDDRSPASLQAYFTTDTAALAGLSGVIFGTIITILVNLIASIVMTHVIAWKIAIVLLATLPLLLGSGFMRLFALAKFAARHQKLYAASASITLEAVASIKTIASLSLEKEIYERYKRSLKGPYKASIKEIAYTNFWLATAYTVSLLIYALAYWWGSKQVMQGTYSQSQFFIVLPALLFSAQSCGQMFALAPDVSNAKVAATRLLELIGSKSPASSNSDDGKTEQLDGPLKVLPDDIPPDDPDPPPSIDDSSGGRSNADLEKGITPYSSDCSSSSLPSAEAKAAEAKTKAMTISLTNVSFAYPTRPAQPILSSLSLNIEPGSFTALVGPSGSGKSTVLSLLASLYTPASGTITFNNAPLNLPSQSTRRDDVGYVPQTCTLFDDTVAFNLSLGLPPPPPSSRTMPTATGNSAFSKEEEDAMHEACRLANIHELIASLPDGYETQCGGTNSHFSGGQKQRLCIARALMRQPRLLLLDEPSSALDAEGERRLGETLEKLRGAKGLGGDGRGGGITIVMVAHRLCTVQNADRIVWVEGGRITDAGTHEEMVRGCKGYREAVLVQSVG